MSTFSSISKSYFPPSVTLVTAKNQHRCWKARAHTRTRRRKTHTSILSPTPRKIECKKNILSLFLDFSLIGRISTHIVIGGQLLKPSALQSQIRTERILFFVRVANITSPNKQSAKKIQSPPPPIFSISIRVRIFAKIFYPLAKRTENLSIIDSNKKSR